MAKDQFSLQNTCGLWISFLSNQYFIDTESWQHKNFPNSKWDASLYMFKESFVENWHEVFKAEKIFY